MQRTCILKNRINLLLLIVLLPFLAVCQDDYDGEGCSECDFDCLMCEEFTTLVDSTAMTMAGDAQGEHCTFVEHQIQWFGFVAGSEDVELTVTTDSCVGSSAVEILIIEAIDCEDYTAVSNCFGAFTAIGLGETEVVANDVPLVVGQYYWIVFDATSNIGDHCSFTLEVTDGTTGAPPITDVPIIDGPPLLCGTETGTYSVTNDIFGAIEFEWYVNGSLESTSMDFDFTPSGTGTYEICAAGISYCESGPLSSPCFMVTVSENTMAEISFAACQGDCIDYLGTTYCSGGTFQEIIPNQAGCDSIIDITFYEIDIDLDISEIGECVNNLGVELVVVPSIDSDPPLNGTEIISWEWLYENNMITGSEDATSIFGDSEGNYSVNYTLSFLGTDCIVMESIDLSFDDYGYDFDTLEDYGDVCNLDIVTYELLYAPYDASDFTVNWTVPPDAFITMGQGTPVVEVDWTGPGGLVCYTVTNFCTTSPEQCFEVNVLGASDPEISLDTMQVCIDELITASALNIPANFDTFMWTLSSGGIIASGTLDQPSDVDVYWPTAGMQSIQLFLNDGCNDYTVVADIEVIENPIFPPYTCLVEGNNLTIDWEEIVSVSSYNANPISGNVGIFNGSSYEVADVNPGDNVQLEIIADGPCGPIPVMITCEVPDCPTTDLIFETNLPDTLCINDTQQLYDLTGFDNAGHMGIGSFSGTGITDTINGTFDITAAGAGAHILSFIYSLNNGDCISKVFDTIQIVAEPILALTADQMIICIGDTVQIQVVELENYYTISETFDNPTHVNEDSSGHYSLSWNDPGIKNIDINIQDPYCGSYTTNIDIEVQSLPDLNITCLSQTTNSITIGWSTDPIYSNYDISLNGNYETTETGSSYTVSGLPIDSTIFFSVLPKSQLAVCPIFPDTISCFTVDCVPVDVELVSPIDTFLCATDVINPIQLSFNYDDTGLDGTESIVWSGPGVSSSGLFTPDLSLGSIVVTATLNYIDCSYPESVTFFVETPPVLSLDFEDEVCIDQNWDLNYTGEINTDYIVSWDTDSNQPLNGLGPHSIDFNMAGDFFFTMNASFNNCNSITETINVTVLDSVRTPQVDCFPGIDFINLLWNVESSECNGDFTVLLNNVIIENNLTASTLLIENLDLETNYQIEIINNSSCLCDSKPTIINCATIPCPENLLTISSPADVFCIDGNLEDILLTAFFDTDLLNSNLIWNGDGIDQNGIIDVSQISEGITMYSVSYIDSENCSFLAFIEIEFVSPPSATFSLTFPICPDDNLGSIMINSLPLPNHEYLIDGQIIDPTMVIDLAVGTHSLWIINDGFCQSSQDIEILPAENYDLVIDGDPVISYGQDALYTIILDPMAEITNISWTLNDSLLMDNSQSIIINSQSGLLCAMVTYLEDCELSICNEIRVTNPNVFIPNIINIDQQSENKLFRIFSNDPDAISEYLNIYDRWGNLVFATENKLLTDEEMAWDGTLKEEDVMQGVYVFVTKVLFSNGQEELFTGNLTLIK